MKENYQIKLSKDLELPTSAVTQTFAFLGKRGGGKTYAAGLLGEQMLAIGAQIIVLDVVGTWYGLRVPKSPKGKAFDILVFGGLNGDIEINPKAGKIVAGIILEKNLSAVVDISQFIHSEQTRFAYDFLITLFEGRKANPGACHVFLEEAQELVPQNIPPGDGGFGGKMLHAGERLVKLGRNFGIGCSLISQRPQEVNKKVLNQTEVLLAFQMTGIQEKKTIAAWVRDKGDETDVEQLLPKLETGQALIWSPTWLKISGTYKIAEKLTADVSATPEVGAAATRANTLAKVDVEELKGSIEALTAEMEANTPAALKKTIGELNAQIFSMKRELENVGKPVVEHQRIEVEVPVFPDEVKELIKSALDGLKELQTDFNNSLDTAIGDIGLAELCANRIAQSSTSNEARKHAKPQPATHLTERPKMHSQVTKPAEMSPYLKSAQISNGSVTSTQQKILDALALCEKLGIENPERINVAFFAGYTVNGHFNNLVGGLRGIGLLDYPSGGRLCLTDGGRELGNAASNPITSLQDFHDLWLGKLGSPEQKILTMLLECRGDPIGREDLAAATGYTVNGHFNNCVGHLKTLGAAYYPRGGYVAASPVMFPEGLY